MAIPTIRLALVGSRQYTDYVTFREQVNHYIVETYPQGVMIEAIISGGAVGVDTLAARYAAEFAIPLVTHLPVYQSNNDRQAPLLRNSTIVADCTHLLAWPSRQGAGTQDTIRKANAVGKLSQIYWV